MEVEVVIQHNANIGTSLELGCGPHKRNPDAVGVDALDYPGVDVVADALEYLRGLPDESVSQIYSEHFLEHIDDARSIVAEASRVLRVGGEFRAIVPHHSNPYFYSDPTHTTFFGLYTMSYWTSRTPLRRSVPVYRDSLPFELCAVSLIFKSSRPFYIRHVIKKCLTFWVNWSSWSQEFYEEMLTPLLPAYEIDFMLVRI